jgi:hypothetical protein
LLLDGGTVTADSPEGNDRKKGNDKGRNEGNDKGKNEGNDKGKNGSNDKGRNGSNDKSRSFDFAPFGRFAQDESYIIND